MATRYFIVTDLALVGYDIHKHHQLMNKNQDQDFIVEPIESHPTLRKDLTINNI